MQSSLLPLRILLLTLLIIIGACSNQSKRGDDTPAAHTPLVAPGAELQLLSDQFSFTEGPAADAAGNVYFTDQPNNEIWLFTITDSLKLFMNDAGRANGLYVDHNGHLLAAADEKGELWSISPTKRVKKLLTHFEGARFNGPNDIWVAPGGGIYFTDPYYQRPYWNRTQKEIPQEGLYFLSPSRDSLRVAAENFERPNGLIGTPDGQTLYVADIGAKRTYRFPIRDDGSLGPRSLFTEIGSDGMTLDARGNVYLTGDGVTIFNPEGQQIAHIPVPQEWTANVTFGGADKQTLFITASKAIYQLRMQVTGAF